MSDIVDMRLGLAVCALPIATVLFGFCNIPGSGLVLPVFLLRLLWILKKQEEARSSALEFQTA